MSLDQLNRLLNDARAATGQDFALDRQLTAHFPPANAQPETYPYTTSVDRCIDLIRRELPDWRWHVGRGPKGIMPYAFLSNGREGDDARHFEAVAPTVPLALIIVLLQAKMDALRDIGRTTVDNGHCQG